MADNTQPPAVPTTCYLLKLSGELRNRIYRYAVIDTDPIRVLQPTGPEDHATGLAPPPSEPALASTNKQIRSEVVPIFWGENVFEVTQIHRGGGLNLDWAKTFDYHAGFHPPQALAGIQRWINSLGSRVRLLRRLTAKSCNKGDRIVGFADVNIKANRFDLKIELQDHDNIVQNVCACCWKAASAFPDDVELAGLCLVQVMMKFCELYFDHKIAEEFTFDGINKPGYRRVHCKQCTFLPTIEQGYARRSVPGEDEDSEEESDEQESSSEESASEESGSEWDGE